MASYLEHLRSFLSWHYFVGEGEAFQDAIAKPIDDLVDMAKQATTQRFWRYALDEALPYLLQNYNLDLVEAFTPDQTRRQIAEAWDTWEKAGSEEGIVEEVQRLGYPKVSLLPVWQMKHKTDGITDTLEFRPSLKPDINSMFWPKNFNPLAGSIRHDRNIATLGEWGAFEWWVDLNFHFSSFFVVIHDPPFAFRRWGDPDVWGKHRRWDALVTGSRVDLRRLYLTIKKFTTAEYSCRGVIFSYSGRYKLAKPLLGVAVRSTYDVWACGQGGYIAHWDGTKWSEIQSGTTQDLHGIWVTPRGQGYAVGKSGTILHYNGATWQPQASGVTDILTGFAAAGRERWVCGQNGRLLLDAGFGWSVFPSPVATALNRLFALAPNDIWAVGVGGVALHYNGGSWTATTTGVADDLYGVWGASSTEVYAVGLNGTIIRWDGTAWTSVASPTTQHLFHITGTADGGNAIAVGDTAVVFNGISWTLAPNDFLGQRAWAVQGTVSDNYWAVTEQGWAYNLTLDGRIYAAAPWDTFTWDDGTRYTIKYVTKWMREKWET
jgi:hypothetical protein